MIEIDELIEVLEADVPASMKSAKSKKLAADLERDLKKYFTHMETLIPMDKLEQIYLKYIKNE